MILCQYWESLDFGFWAYVHYFCDLNVRINAVCQVMSTTYSITTRSTKIKLTKTGSKNIVPTSHSKRVVRVMSQRKSINPMWKKLSIQTMLIKKKIDPLHEKNTNLPCQKDCHTIQSHCHVMNVKLPRQIVKLQHHESQTITS